MRVDIKPKFNIQDTVRLISTGKKYIVEAVIARSNKYGLFSTYYKLNNEAKLIREIDLTREKRNARTTLP